MGADEGVPVSRVEPAELGDDGHAGVSPLHVFGSRRRREPSAAEVGRRSRCRLIARPAQHDAADVHSGPSIS